MEPSCISFDCDQSKLLSIGFTGFLSLSHQFSAKEIGNQWQEERKGKVHNKSRAKEGTVGKKLTRSRKESNVVDGYYRIVGI